MRSIIIFFLCLLLLQSSNTKQAIGGIQLLPSYVYTSSPSIDTRVATISKKGGMVIDIEYGLAGAWANPKDIDTYAWYKEQMVSGHKVIIALTKPGLKTIWDSDESRKKEPGNILLVTIPLPNGNNDPDYVIDFKAEITSPEEMTDMLLMVLTFDPAKLK